MPSRQREVISRSTWDRTVSCGHYFRNTHTFPRQLGAITFARWFWNHTCTTRTLSPVSAARVSLTWRNMSVQTNNNQ